MILTGWRESKFNKVELSTGKGKMVCTSEGQMNCTKVKWRPSGDAAVQQKKHLKLMVNQHDADIKKANLILGSIVTRVICKTHRQSIPLHLRNEDSISTFWESDKKKVEELEKLWKSRDRKRHGHNWQRK